MIRVGKILIYPERKLLILFKTSLSGTNLTAFSQPGRKAQDDWSKEYLRRSPFLHASNRERSK